MVTGGSSGIGAAVAIALAEAGAHVVVNYARSAQGAEDIVAKIQASDGKAIAVQADVSQEEQVLQLFQQTLDAYGTVDILVNNAGIQKDRAFTEMSLEDWNRVIGINLTGQFLCAREAAKEFIRRGSQLRLCPVLYIMVAGIAWGIYSLRGQGKGDPIQVSAGNFLRAVPLTVAASLLILPGLSLDWAGMAYAVASGALASGLGDAVWYITLPALKAAQVATVQLSVPVIAALGGIVFLAEPMTGRLVLTSIAILGGIALSIRDKASALDTP